MRGRKIPNAFELDVSGLDIDDTILVRDISVPVGVIMVDADRVAVAGVIKAK